MRINAYLEVAADDAGSPVIRCTCCEATLGRPTEVIRPTASNHAGLWPTWGTTTRPPSGETRFEIREYYCPSCLVLLDTDVALKGDPGG